MIKNILLYTIVVLSLLLLGCTKRVAEDNGNIYTGERLTMNARLTNGQMIVSDSEISTVRFLIFTEDGEMVFNDIVAPDVVSSGSASFTMEVARGVNNFHVVCNENAELKTKLTAVTKEEDVEKINFQAAGIVPPLPMYGKVIRAFVTAKRDGTNVEVAVDGVVSSTLSVDVDRLMAKLNMTFIKNIADAANDFKVEQLRVHVSRMPKYTTLKAGESYTQTEWAADYLLTGTGTLSNNGDYQIVDEKYTIPTDLDRITFPDIYLPEHLLVNQESQDQATFLLIDMSYRMNSGNTSLMNSTYIVPLGQTPPANHNITRNHHYDLYATIRGLGAMGIYAKIVPFTDYYHPVEWKPFQGYTIVSERESEYGKNFNIWNDYSQYSGILKITKDKVVSSALFRYGGLVAVAEGTSVAAFNPTTDVLWSGTYATPTDWSGVSYQSSGDIVHTVESVRQGKGDPCRLVGLTLEDINNGTFDNELWRMPTITEMEWLNTARNGEVIKIEGFYSFLSLLTPKNGYRTTDGVMVPATTEGRYWSSTAANSFIFNAATNSKISSAVDDPSQAYAVRCIRTDGYRHKSRFMISGSDVNHEETTNAVITISENFLVPYWKIVPDPAVGITYFVTQGTDKVNDVIFSVTALPNPYVSRSFTAKAYGYGIDGVVHEFDLVINQKSLVHSVTMELSEPTNLPVVNGFIRIPKEGITMKFKTNISPAPLPPYDATYNTLLWRANAARYDNKWTYYSGTEVVTQGGESVVVIPPNTWGHIVTVEVGLNWVSPISDRPPHNNDSKIRFVQEK